MSKHKEKPKTRQDVIDCPIGNELNALVEQFVQGNEKIQWGILPGVNQGFARPYEPDYPMVVLPNGNLHKVPNYSQDWTANAFLVSLVRPHISPMADGTWQVGENDRVVYCREIPDGVARYALIVKLGL